MSFLIEFYDFWGLDWQPCAINFGGLLVGPGRAVNTRDSVYCPVCTRRVSGTECERNIILFSFIIENRLLTAIFALKTVVYGGQRRFTRRGVIVTVCREAVWTEEIYIYSDLAVFYGCPFVFRVKLEKSL